MTAASLIQGIHPYPCKFPPRSIQPFIRSGGETLVDPFCGCGTTLVEAATQDWKRVYGFDSNPIGMLISRFKCLPVDAQFFASAESALADLAVSARNIKPRKRLTFAGALHWFDRPVMRELEQIMTWLSDQDDERLQTWLQLSLSRIINRVSRQDSETRYVAVDRNIPRGGVMDRFADSAATALSALRARGPLRAKVTLETVDIRAGLPLPDSSVQRILTSPPYANSMDYYLYHKQRMNVLGFDFKATQNAEIGSRHEYSSQRAPAQKWANDYAQVLKEFRRILRPDGDAVIIIGDSQIAGQKIDAAELTASLAEALGFSYELCESVPLNGRSRSFQPGFQRPNKYEHIIRLSVQAATSRQLDNPVLVDAIFGRL